MNRLPSDAVLLVIDVQKGMDRYAEEYNPKVVGEVNDSLVLLFEPNSTLNTGNVRNERTVPELDRL